MPRKSQILIAKAIYRGNDQGIQKYFTEEELRDIFKMSDTEIKYYRNLVNSVEHARDNLIELLKAKNHYDELPEETKKEADEAIRKQIDKLGGYFPLMRRGKYAVYGEIKDPKTGKPIPFFHFTDKKNAIKTANLLNKMGYKKIRYYPRKKLPPEFFKHYNHLSLHDLDHIIEASGLPYDDPKIKEIREWFLKGRGFSEKVIRRKWVPGFERTPENLIQSIINFNYSTSSRLYKYIARKEAQKILKDEIDPSREYNLYRYASQYIDAYFSTNDKQFAVFKKFLYSYYLAFKTSFLLQNLTQPFLTNLPEIAKYVGVNEALKIWLGSYNFRAKDKELVSLLERANKEGVISGQFTDWVLGLNNPRVSAVNRALGSFGEISEHINRTHDFIAGYKVGRKLGLKGEELYNFCKNIVHKCQYPFGKQNLPLMIEGAGTLKGLGRVATTFRLFMGNYYHWYIQTMKGQEPEVAELLKQAKGKAKGKPWKGKIMAFLTGFLLAGIHSVPFLGLLLWFLKKKTGVDLETKIREKIPEKEADFILGGVPALGG